jgi:hypothetical protein
MTQQDHCTGVLAGLQQPGHELHLVRSDQRRRSLQTQVGLEPAGQHVAVMLPPPGRVGLLRQRQQRRTFLFVRHAVQRQQVRDIALLEADPAQLHSADLGAGRSDLPAGSVSADVLGLAQPSQLTSEQDAEDRRAAARRVVLLAARHHASRFACTCKIPCEHG